MDLRDLDWMVAVPLAFAGLVVLAALLRHRRSRPAPKEKDESVKTAALRARHLVLQRQLRELEEGSSGRSPDILADERQALEQVAAQVRLELEQRGASPDAPPGIATDPGEPASGRSRWWIGLRGLSWAAGGTALLAFLIISAVRADRPRGAGGLAVGAPLGSAHGGHGVASAAPASAEELAAKAKLERNPEDIEARLEIARLRLDQEDYMAVWAETQNVLKKSEDNPRALTYQSQVRLAMNQPEVALDMLERAIAKDPELLQAHVYLSYVHLRLGQGEEARKAIADAKKRFPDEAAVLDSGFSRMQASLGNAPPMSVEGEKNPHARMGSGEGSALARNPHGEPNPDQEGAWAAASPAAAASPRAGARISGTLELDRGLAGTGKSGVVFVTVREAGLGAGPPIAAKKLSASSFPLAFELGDADSMQGEGIPERVILEARLDADGDALTKDPLDPVARQDDVPLGKRDVRLVLKRRQP